MTSHVTLCLLGVVALSGCSSEGTNSIADDPTTMPHDMEMPVASATGGAVGSGGVGAASGGNATGSTGIIGSGGAATGGASSSAGGSAAGGSATGGAGDDSSDARCQVEVLNEELRASYGNLDEFYTKFADADGLPVVSSNAPADEALARACALVIDIVSARPDVRDVLISKKVRFAIIGEEELTNDIPEFSDLPDSINTRARGLGGTLAASCAEESILCNRELDRWRGEGICLHEFAHTIATSGLYAVDSTFQDRLEAAYQSARSAGLLDDTYRLENAQEYWAEGVQDWYYTNLESDPPNGIHNWVDRREELLEFDPVLHGLIGELLPEEPEFVDCYSDE